MSDSGKHGAGHVWRHPYTHADMHRRKMTRAHPFTDTTRHSRTFDTSSPPPQFARCSSREPLSNCWPLIASPDLILALNSGRTRSRNAVRVTIFGSWDASIVVSVGDRGGGRGSLCSALLCSVQDAGDSRSPRCWKSERSLLTQSRLLTMNATSAEKRKLIGFNPLCFDLDTL